MSAITDAKNLLKVEADAILLAAERLGSEFDLAMGGNVSNKFFFGASLGLDSIIRRTSNFKQMSP